MQKFEIQHRLTDLNKYISANRSNKFGGNKLKGYNTDICMYSCRNIKPFDSVYIIYKWYIKNKKMDRDNIAFAKKFINDGFQKAGKIKNDGWKNIIHFTDFYYIDKNEKIVVEIYKNIEEYSKKITEYLYETN